MHYKMESYVYCTNFPKNILSLFVIFVKTNWGIIYT